MCDGNLLILHYHQNDTTLCAASVTTLNFPNCHCSLRNPRTTMRAMHQQISWLYLLSGAFVVSEGKISCRLRIVAYLWYFFFTNTFFHRIDAWSMRATLATIASDYNKIWLHDSQKQWKMTAHCYLFHNVIGMVFWLPYAPWDRRLNEKKGDTTCNSRHCTILLCVCMARCVYLSIHSKLLLL